MTFHQPPVCPRARPALIDLAQYQLGPGQSIDPVRQITDADGWFAGFLGTGIDQVMTRPAGVVRPVIRFVELASPLATGGTAEPVAVTTVITGRARDLEGLSGVSRHSLGRSDRLAIFPEQVTDYLACNPG